jgi:hypothetical protein
MQSPECGSTNTSKNGKQKGIKELPSALLADGSSLIPFSVCWILR